jgi:hypothetical protein
MKTTITAFILALFLSACATTTPQPTTGLPKPVQIPEIPVELAKKATRLPDITDATFGGIIKDGVAADQQYNSVAYQLNSLIDLYNCVRKSVNTDAQSCIAK